MLLPKSSDEIEPNASQGIHLGVADAKQRDIGRAIVRISDRAMRDLRIVPGDCVSVQGSITTVAQTWTAYSEDQPEEIIRMDQFVRTNAGAAVDELVVLRKADVRDAQMVVFATERLIIDQYSVRFLKSRLSDIPLVAGDMVPRLFHGFHFTPRVAKTLPDGPVRITDASQVFFVSHEMTATPVTAAQTRRCSLFC